ncbi:MAG: WXG100 family type VII secretion target [Porphyromonadaceae bacterium]|nr:WXG100 family type VII secretion target [Porphyromonadaceae bacterium]
MASEIKLTPEQMKSRARSYATESANLQKSIQNMDKLIKALQSEWKGDASKAYADRYNSLKPAFKNAKELMDELSSNLKAAAQIMEETDRKIASQLK